MEKQNNKAIFGILVFCFGAMAGNLTMGVLALISQSYADSPMTVIQTVLVTPALVSVIYAPFVGTLLQKVSAKTLVIAHQAALLVYGLIYLFLGGSCSIWVLIIGAGLLGFNQGSSYTLLGLLLADAVKDDGKRGAITGICTAVMNIGGVIITTVGGFLAVTRWQNAYMLYFYFAIAIVLEIFLIPNVKPQAGAAAGPAAGPAAGAEPVSNAGMGKVWAISIHYLFFFLALYVYGTNVSELIVNAYQIGTVAEAGIAASCVTIGGIAAGAFFGVYSTKILKKATVPAMMLLSVLGLGIPVFVTGSVVAIYACGIMLGFAMNACAPYIMEEMHQSVPDALYGKAMSIYSAFMNGGMLVAIYVIAFLTKLFFGSDSDIRGKFIVATVMCIGCLIGSVPIYMGSKKN